MANAVLDKPQKFPTMPTNGASGAKGRHASLAEYLRRERLADGKSEYRDGEIIAVAGASFEHNIIVGNVITELNIALRPISDCFVLPSDIRVLILATNRVTYPDVVVIRGEQPRFTDDEAFDTIRNPTLIVEVLSSSTEGYDRGEKFANYKTIPSLREYVLVSQGEYKVTVFVRDSVGAWQEDSINGQESVVTLTSLGVTVALADLYRRVTITAPTS